jgi:hypothetical protein
MRRKTLLHGLAFLIAVSVFSCKKESDITDSTFLGKWKTSYGDTISFSLAGSKKIIRYDRSMNPSFPMTSEFEYTYRNKKLGIKDGYSATLDGFRFFQSFKWLDEGKSFEIQGVEWFLFLSSTLTYFTFTKIQ